jgi:hypothetical protein
MLLIIYSKSNKLSGYFFFYQVQSIGNNSFYQGIQLINIIFLFSTSTEDMAFM